MATGYMKIDRCEPRENNGYPDMKTSPAFLENLIEYGDGLAIRVGPITAAIVFEVFMIPNSMRVLEA